MREYYTLRFQIGGLEMQFPGAWQSQDEAKEFAEVLAGITNAPVDLYLNVPIQGEIGNA